MVLPSSLDCQALPVCPVALHTEYSRHLSKVARNLACAFGLLGFLLREALSASLSSSTDNSPILSSSMSLSKRTLEPLRPACREVRIFWRVTIQGDMNLLKLRQTRNSFDQSSSYLGECNFNQQVDVGIGSLLQGGEQLKTCLPYNTQLVLIF